VHRLIVIALALLGLILVPWLIPPPEYARSPAHGLMHRAYPGPPLSSEIRPHGFCLIWPVWEHTRVPAYYLVQGRTWWAYTDEPGNAGRERWAPRIVRVPAFGAAMSVWWDVVAHVRGAVRRALGLDVMQDPFHEKRIDDTMHELSGSE